MSVRNWRMGGAAYAHGTREYAFPDAVLIRGRRLLVKRFGFAVRYASIVCIVRESTASPRPTETEEVPHPAHGHSSGGVKITHRPTISG